VVKGLNAGDQVVTAGQMKLRNGAPVTINNTVVPTNNPAPTPTQS
jgi:membrane fusion protein (multidrug efflux system)